MTTPHACPDCLRRSWFLSVLGPYIDRALTGSAVSRPFELLSLPNAELADAVAPDAGRRLLDEVEGRDGQWFSERLEEAGCWAICMHDEAYPAGLRDLPTRPAALIGRGDPRLLCDLEPGAAVTIVGSRRATSYGRDVARALGRDASAAGLVVISALAFGIDASAHRGALEGTGRTVAVLGCGPDAPYPPGGRGLWRRVVEHGAAISELPPGSTPWPWTFTARNRLLAALAGMTVVVEAPARSDSLITADLAADLARDLGAVPGPVTSRDSAGPNDLLGGGAFVVRDIQDVLDALLRSGGKRATRQGGSRSCDVDRGADGAAPAYTVVGNYGEGRIPYVTKVYTHDGPEAALALGHEAFEKEEVGDLELQVVSLFHGTPKLVDFDEPWGGDR